MRGFVGLIAYQREKLKDLIEEITPLFKENWLESGPLDKEKSFLNPDWDVYFAFESIDRLFLLTCRRDGELIGYYLSFIMQHRQYKQKVVSFLDTVFIKKQERKGFLGLDIIKKADESLRDIGVDIIIIGVPEKLFKLVKRAGYAVMETTCYKEF